jgi:hypothetical protein
MMLRRIDEPEREDVIGEWRRLHHEELHNLFSSSNTVTMIRLRRTRWAGHIARMGELRDAYRVLVGKPVRKRPLRRQWHRWEDNIRMDLKRNIAEVVDWTYLV